MPFRSVLTWLGGAQLKCLNCGHCSDTFDPFLDLSMELSGGVRSLDVALKRFTAKETLDTGNKWRCGGCKKLVRAEKRLTVFKVCGKGKGGGGLGVG